MPSPDKRPSAPFAGTRRWLLRLLGMGVLLGLLALGVTWFGRDWLARTSQAIVKDELRKRGIYLDYDRVHWAPLRGLVLSDVEIYLSDAMTRKLFTVSDVAFGFNPLLTATTPKRDLPIRISARSGILVAHPEGEPITFSGVDLTLHFSASRLTIDQLRARGAGHELLLSGAINLDPPPANREPGEKRSIPEKESVPPVFGRYLEPVARIISMIAIVPGTEPPELQVRLERENGEPLQVSGRFQGKKFTWRTLQPDSLDLRFHTVAAGKTEPDAASRVTALAFPSAALAYRGETLAAKGSYDLVNGVVHLDSLESAIDLFAFTGELFPSAAKSLRGVQLGAPPHLVLSGTIPSAHPDRSDLAGNCSASGVTVTLADGRPLDFSQVAGSFHLHDGTLELPDLRAAVLDGEATFAGTLRPFEKPAHLDAEITANNLSLPLLAKLTSTSKGGPGRLHGTFKGSGAPSLAGLSGAGEFHINGAQSGSLQLLRGLVGSITKLLPILPEREKTATLAANYSFDTDYTLGKGRFSTKNFALQKGLLVVKGTADIDLEKKHAAATAFAHTSGVSALVTVPAGLLFEMAGEGPFDNFRWSFKNLPDFGHGEAARAVGKDIEDAGAATGHLLKDLGKATGKVGADLDHRKETGGPEKPRRKDPLEDLLPERTKE